MSRQYPSPGSAPTPRAPNRHPSIAAAINVGHHRGSRQWSTPSPSHHLHHDDGNRGKSGGGGEEWLPGVVCGNWTLSGPGNLVLVRQGKYLKSRCAWAVARNSSLTHPLMGCLADWGHAHFWDCVIERPAGFLERSAQICRVKWCRKSPRSNLRGIKTWNES